MGAIPPHMLPILGHSKYQVNQSCFSYSLSFDVVLLVSFYKLLLTDAQLSMEYLVHKVIVLHGTFIPIVFLLWLGIIAPILDDILLFLPC